MHVFMFQAMPFIETLALEELVDPRLGDSYSTYELYLMAKMAYLCTQAKPSMRPTMGEVTNNAMLLIPFLKSISCSNKMY